MGAHMAPLRRDWPTTFSILLLQKKTENAHLEVEVAGPAKINTVLRLYGKIAMNGDAVPNVSSRFPGSGQIGVSAIGL